MDYINKVQVTGRVVSELKEDHVYKKIKIYKFFISIPRLSGICDILPVMISENIIKENKLEIKEGINITIDGEYKSYDDMAGGKKRLILYIHANEIKNYISNEDIITNNKIILQGMVCSKGELRISRKGRRYVDILVKVDSLNSTYYIPCIIWNWHKNKGRKLKLGETILLEGRIQSKIYEKKYESGESENKVAYEVSILRFNIVKEKTKVCENIEESRN